MVKKFWILEDPLEEDPHFGNPKFLSSPILKIFLCLAWESKKV